MWKTLCSLILSFFVTFTRMNIEMNNGRQSAPYSLLLVNHYEDFPSRPAITRATFTPEAPAWARPRVTPAPSPMAKN